MITLPSRTIAPALLVACALAIPLAGCNRDGAATPAATGEARKVQTLGKEPGQLTATDLFPTTVGAQSSFEVVGNQTGAELTLRVADVQKQGDATTVKLEVKEGQRVTDTSGWRLDAKGIAQTSARNGIAYNPPQMALTLPVTDNAEKKFTGTGPFPSVDANEPTQGQMNGAMRVRGVETVETAMGLIEAVATESVIVYRAGQNQYRQQTVTWFAPKYGIVRYRQSVIRADGQTRNLTLRLKSFTQK